MTKFRDGPLGPAVILFAVCLIVTLALALTYQTTKPIIERADIESAEAARARALPNGGPFTPITGAELPDGVFEAYRGSGGYVFKSGAKGFDGIVTYMIGINDAGEVAGISMLESNETPGLGTKVAKEDYLQRYFGAVNPDQVDGIAGVTRTSDSLKNSIKQAKEAFALVKGE